MQTVYEAQHFTIVVPDRPHVSRPDGGHMIINPKVTVNDRTQLTREPFPFPRLEIRRQPASIFDYEFDDFQVLDYQHHAPIKAPVAV